MDRGGSKIARVTQRASPGNQFSVHKLPLQPLPDVPTAIHLTLSGATILLLLRDAKGRISAPLMIRDIDLPIQRCVCDSSGIGKAFISEKIATIYDGKSEEPV
jgi:hypothetical protein